MRARPLNSRVFLTDASMRRRKLRGSAAWLLQWTSYVHTWGAQRSRESSMRLFCVAYFVVATGLAARIGCAFATNPAVSACGVVVRERTFRGWVHTARLIVVPGPGSVCGGCKRQ